MGENLAQPNLDGISCIISNIQFHLEKKPDKSPERVENFSLVSSLDPSSSSFQIFFLQRCLTPSRTCFRDAFVFHFRSLLSFLTTISLSLSLFPCLSAASFLSRFRSFLFGGQEEFLEKILPIRMDEDWIRLKVWKFRFITRTFNLVNFSNSNN